MSGPRGIGASRLCLILLFQLSPSDQLQREETEIVDNSISSGYRLPPPLWFDPIFSELAPEQTNSSKRAAWDLYSMVKCATGCNPLVFKGYGCFCGFLGSGHPVDGIDRCCKMHDWCYSTTSCNGLQSSLPYFIPYKWKCNGGAPYCAAAKSSYGISASCSHQLCECDREFASCLSDYPCPHKKAMCKSAWRYWQNLFMGLGTKMPLAHGRRYRSLHGLPHPLKPPPLLPQPAPIFTENRLNIRLGK